MRKRPRLPDNGAAESNALPLSTGQRTRLAVQEMRHAERPAGILDAPVDLRPAHAAHLQSEPDVLANGQVRVKGVVLEHHRNVPVPRRQVRDVAVTENDAAAGGRLQAGEDFQHRGLAAARGSDEDDKLTVGNLQREGFQRLHVAVVLVDVFDTDARHGYFSAPAVSPPTRKRSRNRYMRMIGIATNTAAAEISFQSVVYSPRIVAIPRLAVQLLWELTRNVRA